MATKKAAPKKKAAMKAAPPKKAAKKGAAASALTGTAGFPFGRGMKALSGTQTATLSVVFNAKSATSGIIQPGQSRAVTARLVQTPQGPLTLVLDEQ